MKIILNTPQDIVIIKEVKNTINELEVIELVDSPQSKIVWAVTIQLGKITLWEGAEYDAIGQWTDADVVNRLNELYN